MPTYSLDVNGETYSFESDQELDEKQATEIVMKQLKAAPSSTSLSAPTANGLPVGNDFLSAVGRRVFEAGGAALDIPKSAFQMISGGGEAEDPFFGSSRVASGMRLIQGAAAPISTILAPVEAAGESLASGLGANESYSRLAGDVSGLLGTFGLGMLAKAGSLGPYMLRLAEVLGVGRSGAHISEAMKHDPQLRFVVAREVEKSKALQEASGVIKPVEELARGGSSIEELAMAAKSPELASEMLRRKQAVVNQYDEVARSKGLVGEPPPEARFSPEKGIEFQAKTTTSFLPEWMKVDFIRRGLAEKLPPGVLKTLVEPRPLGDLPDLGPLGTLGTPGTVAARYSDEAAAAAYEINLAQMKINQGIEARNVRVGNAIAGVSEQDVKAAVLAKADEIPSDVVAQSPSLGDAAKGVFKFITDKFEADRQIIIPRIKDATRERLTTQIERELKPSARAFGEEVDQGLLKQKVTEKLDSLKLDEWGLEDYITRIWPGQIRILDKEGHLVESAVNGLDARFKIRDLVQQNPELAGKLHTSTISYFDADLLKSFKGRVSRQYKNITEGVELSAEEILEAEKGNFSRVGKSKFNPFLLERQGKSSGYSKDFSTIMNTYDRTLERWMNLTDVSNKVAPQIREIGRRQPLLGKMLSSTLEQAWGFKAPLDGLFDSGVSKIPVVRDLLAPGFLSRFTNNMKLGIVNSFLRFNPKFQVVNSTQLAATLWPIADAGDIVAGMRATLTKEGKALLQQHGISGLKGKVEDVVKGLGPAERMNQEVAFLTLYNKARSFGLSDEAAASYGKLRGNLYSQFLGISSDQPFLFQKAKFAAPLDLALMFQRFPIKQAELLIDLIKDRNFPGAAKWLGVNLALGGLKASFIGNAGWLPFKLYKDIEKEYGKTAADVLHGGLPNLLGVDVSGSVQLFNPPFGKTPGDKVFNFLLGIVGGTTFSVTQAMMDESGVEPNTLIRGGKALIDRVPLFKQLDGLRRLFEGDYDFTSPAGKLRFKGDANDVILGFLQKDAFKQMLGFRQAGGTMGVTEGPQQMRPAELDLFVSALLDITAQRNEVLNFAASRYGAALMAGVDLGESMQEMVEREVTQWNVLWPQIPISGSDIETRTIRRQQSAMQTLGERMRSAAPGVLRQSEEFAPSVIPGGG